MTTLCFLWHMHQPFYKDLWTGQYKLPWTRLHALKDYAGMVEILDEFPSIRQTFNLVPSMIAQIEDYASGAASDPFLEVAIAPAESLDEPRLQFMRRYLFQANVPRMIYRYPRYRELYEKHDRFAIQDLRDLQVLSQIAWFDEDVLARDEELRELIRKGRDFSPADQALMARKQRALLQRVLPVYRDFASRGRIEISTTPFYHPILPLICDTDIAAMSHPDIPLPPRFRYPEDAREQLCRAKAYVREKFGAEPAGLWPSEGSVSDEALAIAADCGFTWAASDNGVLARTLRRDAGPDVTYQAYLWRQQGREIRMLFRDHYLSDLIGFEYQRMDAESAAAHFLSRIRDNSAGREALVPVILDGENAWEWYEANGRPFLRALYRRIAEDPQFEAVTVSEALARFQQQPLDWIFPGSWINANFDIWIGAEEDNRAWELLLEARHAYAGAGHVSDEMRRLAYEELLIAEGSDWNWWYGPEHSSDNRPEFDQLYRDHLSNVYRALGLEPPEALARPILKSQEGEFHSPPANPIHPVLDGEVTSFFEWLGAGEYRPDPRGGAMHGGGAPVRAMFYGADGRDLFVRIDGASDAQFGIEFEGGASAPVEAVRGRIIEMRAPLASRKFRVTIAREGLPPATVPANDWLSIP
ncbi:MAG TPA: glycoside hydrolase family 57 protein [Bryobacteraceae bacterium]|jgi:alpha-amylase/alpha-mannosidase (GH57 family)|nr:glycoside hydrolase family 57 protein [Bryobacteraceae bacterium]